VRQNHVKALHRTRRTGVTTKSSWSPEVSLSFNNHDQDAYPYAYNVHSCVGCTTHDAIWSCHHRSKWHTRRGDVFDPDIWRARQKGLAQAMRRHEREFQEEKRSCTNVYSLLSSVWSSRSSLSVVLSDLSDLMQLQDLSGGLTPFDCRLDVSCLDRPLSAWRIISHS
jgi:hypothetical protein